MAKHKKSDQEERERTGWERKKRHSYCLRANLVYMWRKYFEEMVDEQGQWDLSRPEGKQERDDYIKQALAGELDVNVDTGMP